MLDSLSVPMIRDYIAKLVGLEWEDLETETILLTLFPQGHDVTDLLVDKINVAKIFTKMPHLFFEDVMFFLHACDVFNDLVADFEAMPVPTSLEVAKAIIEAGRMLDVVDINALPAFSEGVRETVKHILIQDGYSGVLFPFNVVGVTGLGRDGFQQEDMKNKQEAVRQYIHGGPVKDLA